MKLQFNKLIRYRSNSFSMDQFTYYLGSWIYKIYILVFINLFLNYFGISQSSFDKNLLKLESSCLNIPRDKSTLLLQSILEELEEVTVLYYFPELVFMEYYITDSTINVIDKVEVVDPNTFEKRKIRVNNEYNLSDFKCFYLFGSINDIYKLNGNANNSKINIQEKNIVGIVLNDINQVPVYFRYSSLQNFIVRKGLNIKL